MLHAHSRFIVCFLFLAILIFSWSLFSHRAAPVSSLQLVTSCHHLWCCHLFSCLLSPVIISHCSKIFPGMKDDNAITFSCAHFTFGNFSIITCCGLNGELVCKVEYSTTLIKDFSQITYF